MKSKKPPVKCIACRGIGNVEVPRTQVEIAARVEALLRAGRPLTGIRTTALRQCGPCGGNGYLVEVAR